MKRIIALFGLVCAVCLLHAQSGEMSGKVLDENGEGLDKVTVTLVNEAGESIGKSTMADVDGNYAIKPLAPGKYNIKITCEGYTGQMQKGVIVNADKATWLNIRMQRDPNYIASQKGKAKGRRKK